MKPRDVGAKAEPPVLIPTIEQRREALKKATEKLAAYDWYAATPSRLDKSFREMGVWGSENIRVALLELLAEIEPEHYRGAFPPELSYEENIKGAPLFAFAWKSAAQRCDFYLKFCFHEDELFIVTAHPQRGRGERS